MTSWKLAFGALAALIVAANVPAIGGGWVYDDRLMVGHPMLDGLEDLGPALLHTSDDYQARDRTGPFIALGTTYRPLPMMTFILVNGTVGPRPWAHHLVSLAFHLIAVALLCACAAREGKISWPALLGVAAFALHPAMGEAYQWINGRSDVMAGAALATVLWLAERNGARRTIGLAIVLAAGILSKETFVIAAAALLAAVHVGARRPRALVRDGGVLVAVLGIAIALRIAAGATGVRAFAAVAPGVLLERFPRIVALAVETIVAPVPRPMRFLAWETSGPFAVAHVLAAALPALVLGWLLARRRWRASILVGGALATLLPVALVADAFWLGFDRYLVLPAILILAAALPWLVARRLRALGVAAGAVAVAGLAAATFASARFYRSHTAFARAMVEQRPDDPGGVLTAALDALDRGRPADAVALLDAMPRTGLPPAAAHEAARMFLALGRGPDAAAIVEQAVAERPRDPNLRFDLLALRGAQRRWAEAAALAEELSADPARRTAVAELVGAWIAGGRVPPEARAALERAVRDHE